MSTQESKEYSDEEIAQMRANMEKIYDEELPFIKKQLEYEDTLARIEEAKLRQITAKIRYAQIMMGPAQEDDEDEEVPSGETKERKLAE